MEDLRKTLKLNLKFSSQKCEVCDWCGKEEKGKRKFEEISGGEESIDFKKEAVEESKK